MGNVMPKRKGRGVAENFTPQRRNWKDDRRQLLAEQIIQHDEDLAKMGKDNAKHDPLWPEFQYPRRT